jgi:hypothetical protein
VTVPLSIAQYATVSDWFSTGLTGATKTITGVAWSAGDIVVVVTGTENGFAGVTNTSATPTNANLTFGAAQASAGIGSGTECSAVVFATTAGSSQSAQTITITLTTGGGGTLCAYGAAVWVITGAPTGTTNATANVTETAPSLTVSSGSVVIYGLMDFNATNPPGKTPLTGSGTATERLDQGDGTHYAQYLCDWVGTSAGTFSFGPNNYTSLVSAQVIVEISTSPFPTIEATAETAVTTAGTSHAITLPTGIGTSDMTLIIMDIGSTSATLNALTDWGEILDESAANGLKILWYTGAGVPSNPTFTSSGSTRSASIAYRISGADRGTTPQIGTTGTGTSATPDPPSVTPTGGTVKNYLFIAFAGMAGEEADDDTWGNSSPTNYSPAVPLQKSCGVAGTNLGGLILAASRQFNTGAAENPGTFGVDVSAAWRSQTIIVHPMVAAETVKSVIPTIVPGARET